MLMTLKEWKGNVYNKYGQWLFSFYCYVLLSLKKVINIIIITVVLIIIIILWLFLLLSLLLLLTIVNKLLNSKTLYDELRCITQSFKIIMVDMVAIGTRYSYNFVVTQMR